MQARLIDALAALGLSNVEAKAYECLLRDGPSTGYRVAQTIGHAAANTYGALASLQTKGAVIADGGTSRHVRAVPADEFLRRLEREFRARQQRASEMLRDLGTEQVDSRIYRLDGADLVFERAERMLRGARYCTLIDAFPAVLQRLADAVAEAGRRSRIVVKAYRPVELKNATVIAAHASEMGLVDAWEGQHLHMVVDARECLLALFDRPLERVRQAIWTGCPFVTASHHVGLQFELMFTHAWTKCDPVVIDALTRTARTGLFDDTGLGRTPGFAEFKKMVGMQAGPTKDTPSRAAEKDRARSRSSPKRRNER